MPVGRELTLEPVERSHGRIGGGARPKDGHDDGGDEGDDREQQGEDDGAATNRIGVLAFGCACTTQPKLRVAWGATLKPRALVPQTTAVL